jgi:SAM-dependent methyltransferase
MYTESIAQDTVRFAKATASNLLARFAPAAYVRLTQQTGRGAGEDSAEDIASYFASCFHDYRQRLGVCAEAFPAYLQGRRVLEYGPGDILGTALLFHAHGATEVECVDRFPLQSVSERNAAVYHALVRRLPEPARTRARRAFVVAGEPASGLRPDAVGYRITPDGLSARPGAFDLIVSRAVLEHVNSLDATLRDVADCLKPAGVSVHNVDLRSHNLDRYTAFDFLTWPETLYRLMYSHKGFPNRWRPDAYRAILRRVPLKLCAMEPTGRIAAEDVERIRPLVARHLRGASAEDLAWTGFWMRLEAPGSAA